MNTIGKRVAGVALSLVMVGGIAACPAGKCQTDNHGQKGGVPREGSKDCDARKTRNA